MTSEPGRSDDRAFDMSEIAKATSWDRVAEGYASFIADFLSAYARDALELAKTASGETVLDVATGPGTLAQLATRITGPVHALDFSDQMLEALRRRVSDEELARLVLRQGDGQALPYDDDTFDAAFSMFGLFMFPDRKKGFAELARVLQPRGRVVVASWQPQDTMVALNTVSQELAREAGQSDANREQPLADPARIKEEMSAAGFSVEVHEAVHTLKSPSLASLWEGLEHAHVALGMARDQLSASRYTTLRDRILGRLQRELGEGPQELVMPAWLALGRLS